MSFYINSGDNLIPSTQSRYTDGLPVGTYTVGLDQDVGFFLSPITDFNFTGKLYGKTEKYATRILNTFNSRLGSTGLLLDGERGNGKTLLAKIISMKAHAQGVSTIIINSPFNGDIFNKFIQSIDESCVIIFDEFEKVFSDQEKQNGVLTLLDGVYPTKKLFILTSNDKHRINQNLFNRPGRVFYMIDYRGIDTEFVREYATDRLNDQTHLESVINVSRLFRDFNFDLLQSLIEEMNRYDESAFDAIELLNAKPTGNYGITWIASVTRNGAKMKLYTNEADTTRNPANQLEIKIGVWDLSLTEDERDDDGNKIRWIILTPNEIVSIDDTTGDVKYVSGQFEIIFVKEKPAPYDWRTNLF